MAQLAVTEWIDAPVEQVFALFSDLERGGEHIRGIDTVEILTDGPIGVGTRWRETRTMWGKQATEVMEVTEFVPGEHYSSAAESHGAQYRSTFRFVPHENGTNVTMEFQATPVSFFARLMNPLSGLMAGSIAKMIRADLLDLKRVLETDGSSG